MIRPARHTDIETLDGLIRRQHAESKFVGRVGISNKALESLLLSLLAGQNQSSVGASIVMVAERKGKVTGFIAGALQRIYGIGDKLEANDHFLVNEGSAADTFAMVDSYLEWATGNRKVLEVRMGWTDAIPGANRIVKLLKRKGLCKSGEVWSLSTDSVRMEVAA